MIGADHFAAAGPVDGSDNRPSHFDAARLRALTPWSALIDALRAAFAEPPIVPLRQKYLLSETAEAANSLLIMPAWRPDEVLGVKLVNVFPLNHASFRLPTVHGLYCLFSAATGAPLATFDAEELTARRTAAASALASSYLSRADAASLLIVGTGRIASQLGEAHAAVRSLKTIKVWGRNSAKAAELARDIARILPEVSVLAVTDLAAAAAQADIISCATMSREPLLHLEDVRPGTHVDLIGGFTPFMIEADPRLVAAAKVYADDRIAVLAEAGDMIRPIALGLATPKHIRAELRELSDGSYIPRRFATDITLFKSVGVALEDLACAELAWNRARRQT
jgi:alanine dehydrogenase